MLLTLAVVGLGLRKIARPAGELALQTVLEPHR
jgi:hypothetical protein